jgi:4-hydroxybenzoate polyprenyltransferase
LILGTGLALAPIGAYLAVSAKFDIVPVLFSFVVLFWVSGFDIIYALQDYEFDKENNLRSIPVIMGKRNALRFSAFLHVITALLLFAIWYLGSFGWLYFTGAVIFSALLFYQHTLVKYNDLSKVNFAFFNLNGYASVLLAIFTIADILAF